MIPNPEDLVRMASPSQSKSILIGCAAIARQLERIADQLEKMSDRNGIVYVRDADRA